MKKINPLVWLVGVAGAFAAISSFARNAKIIVNPQEIDPEILSRAIKVEQLRGLSASEARVRAITNLTLDKDYYSKINL